MNKRLKLINLLLCLCCLSVSQTSHANNINLYFENCINGYLSASGASVTGGTHGITNWMACLLIYCQRNVSANGCQWYNEIVGGGFGSVSKFVQELKNFIAIQQLEYLRDNVVQQVTPPPLIQQTQYSGYKAKNLAPLLQDEFEQRNWQMFVWDMFNPSSYNDAKHVYEHYRNYCSFFEAEFSQTQRYCGNAIMPLPYDLLASTLLGSTVIPGTTTDYIYRIIGSGTTKYFFVDEDHKGEFEARYPNAQQYRSYPNVNKQKAALAYIRNVTNAVPLAAMANDKLFDNKSRFVFNLKNGVPYLRAKYMLVTNLSLARQSLLRMYVDRLPNDSIKKPNNNVSDYSEKTSMLGLLEYESTRRFQNPDWYKEMNKLPKEPLVREIANMMALQSTLNFRMMSHLERVEALLAASIAYNVTTTKDAAKSALVGR